MTRRYPPIVAPIGALGLALLVLAGAASAQFSQDDLAGSFEAFSRWEVESGNDPGWTHTSGLQIDANGNFLGGSLTDSEGTIATVTGGNFAVQSDGSVAGTLQRTVGQQSLNENFQDLQLDPSGNLLVGVDSEDADDAIEIDVAVRVLGSFGSADLVDTWYLYLHRDDAEPNPNDPGWDWAKIAVDGSGQVTVIDSQESDGGSVDLTGLILTITATGNVQSNLFGSRFQMTPDKEVVAGVLSAGDSREIAVIVREGSGFGTGDLAGSWRWYSLVDVATTNAPFWIRGNAQVDSSGNVVSGSKRFDTGTNDPVTSGALTIDADGVVGGSITYQSTGTDTFDHAKMSPSGNVVVGVGPNLTAGSVFRAISIYVLPEPGSAAGALAVLAALSGLRRRSGRPD